MAMKTRLKVHCCLDVCPVVGDERALFFCGVFHDAGKRGAATATPSWNLGTACGRHLLPPRVRKMPQRKDSLHLLTPNGSSRGLTTPFQKRDGRITFSSHAAPSVANARHMRCYITRARRTRGISAANSPDKHRIQSKHYLLHASLRKPLRQSRETGHRENGRIFTGRPPVGRHGAAHEKRVASKLASGGAHTRMGGRDVGASAETRRRRRAAVFRARAGCSRGRRAGKRGN